MFQLSETLLKYPQHLGMVIIEVRKNDFINLINSGKFINGITTALAIKARTHTCTGIIKQNFIFSSEQQSTILAQHQNINGELIIFNAIFRFDKTGNSKNKPNQRQKKDWRRNEQYWKD